MSFGGALVYDGFSSVDELYTSPFKLNITANRSHSMERQPVTTCGNPISSTEYHYKKQHIYTLISCKEHPECWNYSFHPMVICWNPPTFSRIKNVSSLWCSFPLEYGYTNIRLTKMLKKQTVRKKFINIRMHINK